MVHFNGLIRFISHLLYFVEQFVNSHLIRSRINWESSVLYIVAKLNEAPPPRASKFGSKFSEEFASIFAVRWIFWMEFCLNHKCSSRYVDCAHCACFWWFRVTGDTPSVERLEYCPPLLTIVGAEYEIIQLKLVLRQLVASYSVNLAAEGGREKICFLI